MVQSEATQDTIRMTKKVAELIDSTWLALNGCHLGQQSYLQTGQNATYLYTTGSDPVSHNYQQPHGQHIPNNANNVQYIYDNECSFMCDSICVRMHNCMLTIR